MRRPHHAVKVSIKLEYQSHFSDCVVTAWFLVHPFRRRQRLWALNFTFFRAVAPDLSTIHYMQLKHDKCCHSCCSVPKSGLTPCDPIDCSTPGFPVLHHLPKFAQTQIHWVDEAIQPSCLLPPPSLPDLNISQHQGLFQWVDSSHQVAKVLELQLQRLSFQWRFRIDSL